MVAISTTSKTKVEIEVDWELAEKIALRVSGRAPFKDSDSSKDLTESFEEYTPQAELLVEQATGLKSSCGEARAKIVNRDDWIKVNLASLKRLLGPILKNSQEKNKTFFIPTFTSIEIGVVLGWMSTRVLGQYDLLVLEDEGKEDQDIVYYVGPNIKAIESRYAFDPKNFRLWLALHELTHRAQFTGVSWMRQYYLDLVGKVIQEVENNSTFSFKGSRDNFSTKSSMAKLDQKSESFISDTESMTSQHQTMDQISSLMTILEGHGDATMNRAGLGHVKGNERFEKVVRERRKSSRGVTKIFQKLIGLDAKMAQYEEGESFIAEVEEFGGNELVNVLWEGSEFLPTLSEINSPEIWISRIKILKNEK